MAYTKKTFNTWPAWCHQRGSRATTADTSTTGSAHRAHLASDRKVCIWGFVFVWGGTRARPWVSRRGASFQHAYFSPKYPYLPDLVFNDSLFQVQHRLDYLGPMLVVISLGSCHSSFPHHSYKYWHALSWSRRERHQYPSAKSTNTYPTTFKTTAPTELSTTHLWVFGGIASCC